MLKTSYEFSRAKRANWTEHDTKWNAFNETRKCLIKLQIILKSDRYYKLFHSNITVRMNFCKYLDLIKLNHFLLHLYGIFSSTFQKVKQNRSSNNKKKINNFGESFQEILFLKKKWFVCCQIQFHLLYIIGLIGFKDRTWRGCFNKLSFNHLSSILLWFDNSYYTGTKKFESIIYF